MEERTEKFEKFLKDCEQGNLIDVIFYVKTGNDLSLENDLGLGLAVCYNHIEVAKYLIANGANPYSGKTMYDIVESSFHGHLEMTKYLWDMRFNYLKIDPKEDIRKIKKQHEKIIIWSCFDKSLEAGSLPLIKFWIENGALIQGFYEFESLTNKGMIPNKSSYNAAEILAAYGHLEILIHLVEEHDIDVLFNDQGALLEAARNEHYHIINYLLKKGCNLESLKNKSKELYEETFKYIIAQNLSIELENNLEEKNNIKKIKL